MATIAMVFGMLPIALASGPGAEWKNGLAWVIIGGLMEETYVPAESEDGFTPVHVV